MYSATVLLLASSAAVLYALDRSVRWPAVLAVGGMAAAGVLFLLAALLPSRRVDWNRIRAEQRLWESGPLGRAWLRIRQRLSNLWKL